MTARPDPIRVVHAAYQWEPDERAWLQGLLDTCHGYDVGAGVVGYLVRSGAKTEVTSVLGTTSDADTRAIHDVVSSFTPTLARQVLAPTEFVGNAAFRLGRIARALTGDLATTARTSIDRMPTMWALISGDVTSRALLLCFPRHTASAPGDAFPHADSRTLGLAGAHISAALRLRDLALPSPDDDDTEAVLTPTGKVLHATGAAATERGRESLTRSVLASARARRTSRTAAPAEALREWTSLVQGHWTILETVERDGKRLVLARRNRLRSPDLLALTADERDVAWLAALGHSYKYIGYELGLPIGTVSGRLRRAMRKLRVKSRVELLQRLGPGATGATGTTEPPH
ncbi:MAG: response regulator transcription factor [Kofleriaceae bacterium]